MSDQTGGLPAVPGPGSALTPVDAGGIPEPEAALVPRKSSKIRRRRRRVPAVGDGDHRYEAVQHKLTVVIEAMTAAVDHLEGLDRRARATAKEAAHAADAINRAQLDDVFVGMTQEVSTAQTEAARAVRKMLRAAQQAAKDAYSVRRAHAKYYGALHRVRKGRKWRTPKPDFFSR
ncbi:conjugal transfer protein TraB [Kitasatospora sp. NBC_01300]|uniref:conjugal transfer protein TraB n=1 Tax=Kitasatospora sp. NBC_01300 TaxID=2903574 RepID=UPI002F915794|nr:conjugal transfer protein TraB [Kitasatospora sp. NBC_01300]